MNSKQKETYKYTLDEIKNKFLNVPLNSTMDCDARI